MTPFFARGTAMVETALSVGVSLLLVLGAAQMALIGYTQISADGAAFIAAHTVAQNPSANGVNAATQVFSNTESDDYSTPSPSPLLDPVLVKKNVAGFSLIPGVASSYQIAGKDLEYAPANAGSTPAGFQFEIKAYLYNVCQPAATTCPLPSNNWIYLAQNVQSGNGNGANGQFAEWRCHQRYLAKIGHDFPNSYPSYNGNGYTAYVQGTQLDAFKNNTDENSVYGWDTGKKCV